jgi:hypothetical protein
VNTSRRAPVASPYQLVMLCQSSQHREIALPGRLTIDILHDIAREPEVMDADLPELRCALIEQGYPCRFSPLDWPLAILKKGK